MKAQKRATGKTATNRKATIKTPRWFSRMETNIFYLDEDELIEFADLNPGVSYHILARQLTDWGIRRADTGGRIWPSTIAGALGDRWDQRPENKSKVEKARKAKK